MFLVNIDQETDLKGKKNKIQLTIGEVAETKEKINGLFSC